MNGVRLIEDPVPDYFKTKAEIFLPQMEIRFTQMNDEEI
jgi:hypothetical protein